MANLDLNVPINWDEVDKQYDGDVADLQYVYVFEEGDNGKLHFVLLRPPF